jgi:hypothetical protein
MDFAAPTGVPLVYRVVAVDRSGNVSGFTTLTVTRPRTPGRPAATAANPSGLSAAPATSHVDLTWQRSTPALLGGAGPSGYVVERKGPGESSFRAIANVAGTSHRDAGLVAGATYAYRVRARNAAGLSPYSEIVLRSIPSLRRPESPDA